MATVTLTADQIDALAALANAIIPADDRDAGAAAVNAGPRLADKIANGVNAPLYLRGLETAGQLAQHHFASSVAKLSPQRAHELIALVRDALPAFFKQLRVDVSALYLSDPDVWQRIGFPGPSTEAGGHPDFDQQQVSLTVHTKT
jgi:hypothetical protein